MTASRTPYTARFQTPDRIERGSIFVLTCPVYYLGVVATAASATFKVIDGNGKVIKSGAATIDGSGIAEATLAAVDTADVPLADGWTVEWVVTLVDGGIILTFRNSAALVYRALYPVITDLDLFRRYSALDYSNPDRVITDKTNYQDFIDEAWVWLDGKVVKQGRRPWLIASPTDLREVHILFTLHLIFGDLSQRAADAYLEISSNFRMLAGKEFDELSFIYYEDETGFGGTRRSPANPTTWLNGRGGDGFGPARGWGDV